MPVVECIESDVRLCNIRLCGLPDSPRQLKEYSDGDFNYHCTARVRAGITPGIFGSADSCSCGARDRFCRYPGFAPASQGIPALTRSQ